MLTDEDDERKRQAENLIEANKDRISLSLIVASALFSDAEILYSEDMQNGLLIENSLKIVNPFNS